VTTTTITTTTTTTTTTTGFIHQEAYPRGCIKGFMHLDCHVLYPKRNKTASTTNFQQGKYTICVKFKIVPPEMKSCIRHWFYSPKTAGVTGK